MFLHFVCTHALPIYISLRTHWVDFTLMGTPLIIGYIFSTCKILNVVSGVKYRSRHIGISPVPKTF